MNYHGAAIRFRCRRVRVALTSSSSTRRRRLRSNPCLRIPWGHSSAARPRLPPSESPRNRWCLGAAAMGLAMCSTPQPPPTRAQDSVEIARDSAAAATDQGYQAQLARYRHDEAIVDSITRVARQDPILRNDSLYRVYRWALRPQGVTVADVNILSCLETALAIRYGIAASDRVVKQLRDTVFRDRGITNAVDYYWSRAPSRGRLDSENCMREQSPHPDEIDGTSLSREPSPPRLSPSR